MAYKCDNCDKKTVFGVTQRHGRGVAGKRWKKRAQETKRTFQPNIQAATIMLDGVPAKVKLCTRCIKRFRKEGLLSSQRISASL